MLQRPPSSPSLLLGLHPSTASARRRRGWRASCDASSSWRPPLTGALLPLIPSHLLLAFPLSRSLDKVVRYFPCCSRVP